jgi:hypothetical protein
MDSGCFVSVRLRTTAGAGTPDVFVVVSEVAIYFSSDRSTAEYINRTRSDGNYRHKRDSAFEHH